MLTTPHLLSQQIADEGFALIDDLLSSDVVSDLRTAIECAGDNANARQRRSATYAVRNLFDAVPRMRMIVDVPAVRTLMTSLLGDGAFVTRAILFDKIPDANWAVPWHQDTTIAVRSRPTLEPAGFGPWSVKAGVQHVQPPANVLDGMLTLRLHIDDCGEDNAALRVIPGSHREGILEGDLTDRSRVIQEVVTCAVESGGALLMKPLLLHASSAAIAPGHRRVIHLEWAAAPLPAALEWNRA